MYRKNLLRTLGHRYSLYRPCTAKIPNQRRSHICPADGISYRGQEFVGGAAQQEKYDADKELAAENAFRQRSERPLRCRKKLRIPKPAAATTARKTRKLTNNRKKRDRSCFRSDP